jgi:CspA family cold shock protein
MKKLIAFLFLLTAMVSQAAPKGGYPVIVPFPNSTAQTQKTVPENGTVKWFNDAKGYGFITRDSGEDLFVHFRNILGNGFRSLKEGEKVRFVVIPGQKGAQAEQVEKIN